MKCKSSYCGLLLGALWLTGFPGIGHAQNSIGKIEAANPSLQGDGTLGPAAAAAMSRGPLPMSDADVARKRAADRASQNALRPGPARPVGPRALAESGGAVAPSSSSNAPVIVADHGFAGVGGGDKNPLAPSDATGAIGPNRYIQTVNSVARIYNRGTHEVIASGPLNRLAGNNSSVFSFDPQIMWDPTTERFYYVMDSVFSANDNRLAFGFSRTPNPSTISSADWCQYTYAPADPGSFPDYPKLGDSRHFIIIGVNSFKPNFIGSDLIAISKPPAGTACPDQASFKQGVKLNLKTPGGQQVFTPVPSNQVDNNATGFVVARNGVLPSNKLWFFNVTRNATNGNPVFGPGRSITVSGYDVPPNAGQPDFKQTLDTLDARPTQAVQAINPRRSGIHSFYVQHTVRHKNPNDNRSVVRWYEINPAPPNPRLLRNGEIGTDRSDNYFFNAAISPDRQRDGAIAKFGNSFVIEYNVSSRAGINPRIVAGSSRNGKELEFLLVRDGIGPYRDFSCPNDDQHICRWGDYSSAAPDPRPRVSGSGQVWGTNQYSGKGNPPGDGANFRTWIFAIQP